jgi:hypothetical protein
VTVAACVSARPIIAQQAEVRADATLGGSPVALVGGGLFVDAGLYARVGVTAAAGVAWHDAEAARQPGVRRAGGVGEVAVMGRFLLDPLRQAPRRVYVGGGLGARVRDDLPRYFLLALLGVEGRPRAGVAPAAELGVGGGVRLAVVLRRTRPDRR